MDQVLYLVPVGGFDEDFLTFVCQELQEEFGRPSEVAPALPHPWYAYDSYRHQHPSSCLVNEIRGLDLPGVYRVLGVALIGQEILTEAIWGPVCCPGREGGPDVSEVDIENHLYGDYTESCITRPALFRILCAQTPR